MAAPWHLPITDAQEIHGLARELPFAVGEDFVGFVLGFPHRYLAATARTEIVKHYGLMRSLGQKAVISSLAREERLWKLCLVARDRRFLFSRIAGALTCFGMNIVAAEAFANANSLVLDTIHFADPESSFEKDGQRRSFQVFLEDAVEGKVDLETRLAERLSRRPAASGGALSVRLEDDDRRAATRLTLSGHDQLGFLYLVSRLLSEEGCNIELAYIDTPGGEVRDEFFLTRDGAPLTPEARRRLEEKLLRVGDSARPDSRAPKAPGPPGT
jgi:[protein-PII] uridylyltransferase